MNGITTSIHQPAIQAALDCYAKTAALPAARAEAALQILLQDLYHEPDLAIAWQSSTLTGDGFPLEFAFTPLDTDLRYTTEISTPLTSPKQRLALACERLEQLGQTNLPAELLEQLQQMQHEGSLRYGAWVGGRHGIKGDSYKLYAEVPVTHLEKSQSWLAALQAPHPQLADRQVLLRMIGYNLTSRKLEVYFRVPQAEAHHLPRLMAPCGVGDRLQELWEFLEASYGYDLRGKVPGGSIGFSYSLSPDGEPPVFTLFLFARVFWGGDANIRQRFSSLAAQQNWDTTVYEQMTASLALRNTWATDHGLLGFGIAPKGPIAVSVGVRP